MTQPDHIMKLSVPDFNDLDEDTKKYLNICLEKLGLQANVLRAYTFNQNKFRTFSRMNNEIVLGDSGLSVLEREMIVLVVMNWRSTGLSEKYHSVLRYAKNFHGPAKNVG